MGVCYNVGTELGRNDLSIFLTDEFGIPTNAAEIYYAIYYVDSTSGFPGTEVLIGPAKRTPVNPSVGEYYAALLVPPGANPGDYRIRWFFKQTVGGDTQEVVQEFGVMDPTTGQTGERVYSTCEAGLIDKFRVHLRDNAPDRNYHFRPPEQEGVIGKYNRVFGYIWEDYELYCYLELGLMTWNAYPPETSGIRNLNALCAQFPQWIPFVIWAATVHAMFAISTNMIAEEFDYSIGGISLSIDRSSKYQGLKDNAESQFTKATEAKMMTVKVIRGLQQSKFGMGVRSAFGPSVGRGVLSPRSFLGFAFLLFLQGFWV